MTLYVTSGNTKGGSIIVPLTSCLTGLESADNFCFYLQRRLIQTSQTGGQQYSDTYPFSIPWLLTSVQQAAAFLIRRYNHPSLTFTCNDTAQEGSRNITLGATTFSITTPSTNDI
jgi:hypothetical protein